MAEPNFRKATGPSKASAKFNKSATTTADAAPMKDSKNSIVHNPLSAGQAVKAATRPAKAKTPAQVKAGAAKEKAAKAKKDAADKKKKDAELAKKMVAQQKLAVAEADKKKADAAEKEMLDNLPVDEGGRVTLDEYDSLIHSRVKEMGIPKMLKDEFIALYKQIKNNGYDPTLGATVFAPDEEANGEKKIIDGLHRYAVTSMLKLKPLTRDWHGKGSLSAFILGANTRRSLSVSQRSMIGRQALPMIKAEAEARAKAGKAADGETGRSRDIAGKAVGVSGESIRRADKLAEKSPELAKQVAEGKLTMTEAEVKAGIAKSKPDTKDDDDGLDYLTTEEYIAGLPIVQEFPYFKDNPAFVADVTLWLVLRYHIKDLKALALRNKIGDKYTGQFSTAVLTLINAPDPSQWQVNPADQTAYTMYGEKREPKPVEFADDQAEGNGIEESPTSEAPVDSDATEVNEDALAVGTDEYTDNEPGGTDADNDYQPEDTTAFEA